MIAHEMSYNAFWLYTASPLGAIIAPFFLGLCVDRFFNAERCWRRASSSVARSCGACRGSATWRGRR